MRLCLASLALLGLDDRPEQLITLACSAGRAAIVPELAGSDHGAKRQRGSPFPLFSAIRKVAKCPEYRHVVPGHPPLCDLSSFNAEHGPEIKLRLATRRRERAHWSLLRALIRGPCSDEIPFSDQMLDRLHGIGKNRRILPQKLLNLIETPSLDTRRCFAVADDIGCDEVVERIRLTAVPSVEKTPDHSLILQCVRSDL